MEEKRSIKEEIILEQLEAGLMSQRKMIKRADVMLDWSYDMLKEFFAIYDDISELDGLDTKNPKFVAWAMKAMDTLLDKHSEDEPLTNVGNVSEEQLEDPRVALDNVLANMLNVLITAADKEQFLKALSVFIDPGLMILFGVKEVRKRQEEQ